MTEFVQAISRYRATRTETETVILTLVAQFCGACLFAWLMYASYGLDLSPGFF